MKHTNTKKFTIYLKFKFNSTCKQGTRLQLVPSCVFICALRTWTRNVPTVLGAAKHRWSNTAPGPHKLNADTRTRPENNAGWSYHRVFETGTDPTRIHRGDGMKGRRSQLWGAHRWNPSRWSKHHRICLNSTLTYDISKCCKQSFTAVSQPFFKGKPLSVRHTLQSMAEVSKTSRNELLTLT